MKKVIYIFVLLALVLGIYNITKINFDAPMEGNSSVALIGVLACSCAIVLLLILRSSRKISEKVKEKKS